MEQYRTTKDWKKIAIWDMSIEHLRAVLRKIIKEHENKEKTYVIRVSEINIDPNDWDMYI